LLKKEVRILGLSATPGKKKQTLVIGVVFRGNLWLDGILTGLLKLNKHDHVSGISRAIMQSKQYSQLRAVILSREQLIPGEKIRMTDLARRIKVPVICIIREPRGRATKTQGRGPSNANRYDLVVNGQRVPVLAVGLSHEGTQDIFSVACTPKWKIPEAVRVADLIAKQVPSRVLLQGERARTSRGLKLEASRKS